MFKCKKIEEHIALVITFSICSVIDIIGFYATNSVVDNIHTRNIFNTFFALYTFMFLAGIVKVWKQLLLEMVSRLVFGVEEINPYEEHTVKDKLYGSKEVKVEAKDKMMYIHLVEAESGSADIRYGNLLPQE
jgi:hypothetical protein